MADPKDEVIDIDSLSDEDFMKLDPSQMQEVVEDPTPVEEEPPADEDPAPEGDDQDETPDGGADPEEGDPPGSSDTPDGEAPDPGESADEDEPKDPPADESDAGSDEASPEGEKPDAPKGEDEKSAKSDDSEKPKAKDKKADTGALNAEQQAAVDFFAKVSAPFKADGRDMQVKSPEDAIRLMQMGVNYSRRMQEIKPLRAQDQMLKANGLNDPEKLNFLIDLSKGNPDAIKKLLKDHKIDPIDIDTSSEDTPYQATNYQSDPKDVEFDEAIKNTIAQDGGRDLITDINKDWDDVSKEALRDQPAIFENLLAQKASGVYSKIKTELEYQRTMGFLNSVPFLQAYHQVGEAMQKAGVFDSTPQDQPPVKKTVGTGPRKAAPKPKSEQPTPNVSSATPPRSAPSNDGGQPEPDYSSMSDEEFLKMAPPG